MKRMTVVFENDRVYVALKEEAARRKQPLGRLVAQILQEWVDLQEDNRDVVQAIEAAPG